MSKIQTEQRIAGLELRDVELTDNLKYLSGIVVPYGDTADIGWFMEEFAPGSLSKSIKEAARGLPLHLFHDDMPGHGAQEGWPIGVSTEWDDNASRLRGVWELDDSPKAQRAARLAKPDDDGRSKLGYMSVRFAPIRSQWTYAEDFNPDLGPGHKDHVNRLEARLVSVGLVSTPAYTRAPVEWVRSAEPQRARDAASRELDEWSAYLEQVKAGPTAVS